MTEYYSLKITLSSVMDGNNREPTKKNDSRASKEACRTSKIQSSITHRNMSSALVIFIIEGFFRN